MTRALGEAIDSANGARPPTASGSHALDDGYTAEVDTFDTAAWYDLLGQFDDANIFQTRAYGTVASGDRNLGHLVLERDGVAVAMAQARIAKVPGVGLGIAHVRWGPLWRRQGERASHQTFRMALRALRNEFACRRRLVLRLVPLSFDVEDDACTSILREEGFAPSARARASTTILMDLAPPLDALHDGMRPHWKRELKIAERKRLEVVEGTDDALFGAVEDIHAEMVARKRFVEGADIAQFRRIQSLLPPPLKLGVMTCSSSAGLCAGVIWSAMGRSALYLFGATANAGMKSNGSYLLQWMLIERLKREGRICYDLNGINPVTNPGTCKFKRDLAGINGREVRFTGQFETYAAAPSHFALRCYEGLGALRSRAGSIRASVRWPALPGRRARPS
jgi:hypothetical protein